MKTNSLTSLIGSGVMPSRTNAIRAGVDIQAFIGAVKLARFARAQLDEWRRRLEATIDAQRELLFGTLHGIYCDPASREEARLNALDICRAFAGMMTPKAKSTLVERHQD
jgi:hypothetical protein